MTYVTLHNHSCHSYDGLGTVEDWVKYSKKYNLSGVGLTEHGNCSSALELYYYGKKHNQNVILGEEFYLVENPFEKNKDFKYYHITVWVKNNEGYKNLCRLSSLGYDEKRFYYKPRIGFDDLFAHKEGLMIGSGCLAGKLSRNILDGNEKIAREYCQLFYNEFKEDYYLEIQPSVIDKKAREEMKKEGMDVINPQEKVNRQLIEYHKEFNIPIISTPDAHMPSSKHRDFHSIKLGLLTGNRWDFEAEYSLSDYDGFKKKFAKNHPYVLDNNIFENSVKSSLEVLEKSKALSLDIDNPFGVFGPLLPDYRPEFHPLYEDGLTIELLTLKIIKSNGRIDLKNTVYKKRLNRELKELVYNGKINLLSYFLTLEDVIRWCKNNGVTVGPGRGSGVSSLLCYGLGITSIDPIKYGLLFSRFINLSRIIKGTLPDIDLDFSDPNKVKKYVEKRYGEDKVCSISTVMTFKLKSAFKDIVRIKYPDVSFSTVNYITKMLPTPPEELKEVDYLDFCLENDEKFKNFISNHPGVEEALRYMIGQQRQRGIHAAASVISPIPISDIIPTFVSKGNKATQYDYEWCEKAGVIKFDILGLNTLNDISSTTKLIKERHNKDINIYDDSIDLNDSNIFNDFKNGDTVTVFQYNSTVAQSMLTKIKSIISIEELAIITSLGRPSTMQMGMHEKYIKIKNGIKEVEYPHSSLKEILEPTLGIIIYQEQVMKACQILGGFTESEADDIRRAMGKKKKDVMDKYKVEFIKNSVNKFSDIDKNKANKLWNLLESFSGYGFNKSHAIAYAYLGYMCMYFKHYYPIEWWCGVLMNMKDKDELKEFYPYVKDKIVMPNIIDSSSNYYINSDNKIVIPLGYIKKVGVKAVEEIENQRKKGPFTSFEDFFNRVRKNTVRVDVMENLILSDVFKPLHPDLTTMDLINMLHKLRKKTLPKKFQNLNNFQLIKYKEECIPIMSIDYIKLFYDMVSNKNKEKPWSFERIKVIKIEKDIMTAGVVEKVNFRKTKTNKEMAFMSIRNKDKEISLVCWENIIKKNKDIMKKGSFIKVYGKTNFYNNKTSVIPQKITHLM